MARSRSSKAAFDALWRAYAEGRLEQALHLFDPECELRMLPGGRRYRGREGVLQWLADTRRDYKTLTVSYDRVEQVREDCVVAVGRAVATDYDGAVTFDRPIAWVSEFREGRLVRGTGFPDEEQARGYALGEDHGRAAD